MCHKIKTSETSLATIQESDIAHAFCHSTHRAARGETETRRETFFHTSTMCHYRVQHTAPFISLINQYIYFYHCTGVGLKCAGPAEISRSTHTKQTYTFKHPCLLPSPHPNINKAITVLPHINSFASSLHTFGC